MYSGSTLHQCTKHCEFSTLDPNLLRSLYTCFTQGRSWDGRFRRSGPPLTVDSDRIASSVFRFSATIEEVQAGFSTEAGEGATIRRLAHSC